MAYTFPTSPADGDIFEKYKWNASDGVWELNLPDATGQFTPMVGSGGTEATSGGYKYHTFTSSGTFTVTQSGACEVLIIAGGGTGGGGGYSAGGGAGGLSHLSLNIPSGDYNIFVGAGGAPYSGNYPSVNNDGTNGSNSSFGSFEAAGGGRGGCHTADNTGYSGGSGGGSCQVNTGYSIMRGGGSVNFQGNDGGKGPTATYYTCGGGGGAGASGGNGNGSTGAGGVGGIGSDYSVWAAATSTGDSGYYAGGGGGVAEISNGLGGLGGGGNSGAVGEAGQANTGGGGGGWGGNAPRSNGGGSGIVIVRYQV